jgi:hypothetical protein
VVISSIINGTKGVTDTPHSTLLVDFSRYLALKTRPPSPTAAAVAVMELAAELAEDEANDCWEDAMESCMDGWGTLQVVNVKVLLWNSVCGNAVYRHTTKKSCCQG